MNCTHTSGICQDGGVGAEGKLGSLLGNVGKRILEGGNMSVCCQGISGSPVKHGGKLAVIVVEIAHTHAGDRYSVQFCAIPKVVILRGHLDFFRQQERTVIGISSDLHKLSRRGKNVAGPCTDPVCSEDGT